MEKEYTAHLGVQNGEGTATAEVTLTVVATNKRTAMRLALELLRELADCEKDDIDLTVEG